MQPMNRRNNFCIPPRPINPSPYDQFLHLYSQGVRDPLEMSMLLRISIGEVHQFISRMENK